MKRQAWAVALVVMAACCQVQAAEVVKILVRFSDNSSIPLVFRERPANYLPEIVSPAEGVRILEPAALAGDARKAYAIFAIIDICRRTTAAEVSRFDA